MTRHLSLFPTLGFHVPLGVVIAVIVLASSALQPGRVTADGVPQWTTDGVALCAAAKSQFDPTITSDGSGGAIVVWRDARSDSGDIYVQRVSAEGVAQWTAHGVGLCTAAGTQYGPTICSDGLGGAIVTWGDQRSGNHDVYAQRVSAGGVPLWAVNGVALCSAVESQRYQWSPTICSDDLGGAIVTWVDQRSGGGTSNIYAQRVSAEGAPQWTVNGVGVRVGGGFHFSPLGVSDGLGGAIVVWDNNGFGIYAQHVSAGGVPQWTANGAALCTAPGTQHNPTIASDGLGGAIVAWQDYRGVSYDVYCQRVSAGGVPQWAANGVALCTATGGQVYPTICSDGLGGAIVTWQDYRGGGFGSFDVYAERVSGDGVPQWTTDGVALSNTVNHPVYSFQATYYLAICSDGAGGAVATWYDNRGADYDVYAQRVGGDGVPLWMANGVALSSAAGDQTNPTMCSNGAGGAIVVWRDARSDSGDIYVQRVSGGTTDVEATATPLLAFAAPRPNPARAGVDMRFSLPEAQAVTLGVYDLAGREVRELKHGVFGAGSYPLRFDLRDEGGRPLVSGLYFLRLNAGGRTLTRRLVVMR